MGFKSKSNLSTEGRLHPSFQGKATSQPLSLDCQQVCKPVQKQGPVRSSVSTETKASSRKGGCQVLAGFLQPPFLGSKAQRKVATNPGPEQTQPLPRDKDFQDGNSGDNPVVPSKRGMGHFAGFQ